MTISKVQALGDDDGKRLKRTGVMFKRERSSIVKIN
jgi:hypothetical protein